ncbi:MAG: DNRLRE domain-containing protein [Clostridia bacterium]|nr:DNRLRE domain-containing protein [Clostridia bacterium]
MKRLLSLFVAFTILSSYCLSSNAEEESEVSLNSLIVNSFADAMVFNERPDSNFGNITYCTVAQNYQYGLIKFSSGMIDSPNDIVSVKLKLHKTMARYLKKDSISIGVYAIDEKWKEDEVTYSNAPALREMITTLNINRIPGYEYEKDSDYVPLWVECDVTDYVVSQLETGNKILSFYLSMVGNGIVSFDVKEKSREYAPKLEFITQNYENYLYSKEICNFVGEDIILYKNSNVSYINNVITEVGGNELQKGTVYESDILYVPTEYAKVNFSSQPEEEAVFGEVSYIKAESLASILNLSLVRLSDEVFILTADSTKYESISADIKTGIENAKYGLYAVPDLISNDGCIRAESSEYYDVWKERFENRNESAAVKELADEFAAVLDKDNAEISYIFEAYERKNYEQFFLLFLNRFFEHINNMEELKGYSSNELSTADELYSGIKNIGGDLVYIGNPGEINWQYGVDFYNGNMEADCDMIAPITYSPLLEQAYVTYNSSYLNKWCDYIDGLYLSIYDVESKYPLDSGMSGSGLFQASDALIMINELSKAVNATEGKFSYNNGMPYIRFLLLLINFYLPDVIVRNGVHPQNWNIATQSILLRWSEVFKDFAFADSLAEIAISRGEAYLTQRDYPDGVESQRTYNYDAMLVKEFQTNMKDLEKYQNEYWTNNSDFYKESVFDRANFTIRRLTNTGRFFQNGSVDFNKNYADDGHHTSWGYIPELKEEGTVTGDILNVTSQNGDKTVIPEINSDSFPYGGYYFIRSGWNENDQYASFVGHTTDSVLNDSPNSLVLYAYGQLMLANNVIGFYSSPSSAPLTINGASPITMSKWLSVGHQELNKNNEKILPWKNHTSNSFDYVEGEYSNDYSMSRTMNFSQQMYILENSTPDNSHKREVNFLKDCGLWIVTDEVYTNKDKLCALKWGLFCKDKADESIEGMPQVDYEDFEYDSDNRIVRTNTDGVANLSIYNFSSLDSVTMKVYKTDVNKSTIPYSIGYAENSFINNGTSTHVAFIYPRQNVEDEIESIHELKADGAVGAQAKVKDYDIQYMSAVEDKAQITLGDVSALCESLVLQKDAAGEIKGMIFGCENFCYRGENIDFDNEDFEFSIKNNRIESENIFQPLNLPEIKPGISEFSDQLTVSISHELGDEVNIIYTTDGSEPVIENPTFYTEPFVISDTVTVKARAVRKGVTKTPKTMSATHMSYTAKAYYTHTNIKQSVKIQDETKLSSGLKYKYYTLPMPFWGKLYMKSIGGETNTKIKSEGKSTLFDISEADVENPFLYVYTGYLKADSTGNYSFIFPEEYYRDDISAGYGLSIYIDGEHINPSQKRNSIGTYTVGLEKGYHDIEIRYADIRGNEQKVKFSSGESYKIIFNRKTNAPNFSNNIIHPYIWEKSVPRIYISKVGTEEKILINDLLYN